jgi:hypothetical protein
MTTDPSATPLDERPDDAPPVSVSLSAEISDQWSWASSSARIPQISSLAFAVADDLPDAKISVVLRDGDELFGSTEREGSLPVGTTQFGSLHVPLSTRAMAGVDERRGAECVVELGDGSTGRVLARLVQAVDLQPRDLWFWKGVLWFWKGVDQIAAVVRTARSGTLRNTASSETRSTPRRIAVRRRFA